MRKINPQPNFEALKVIFYNSFKGGTQTDMSVLLSGVHAMKETGKMPKPFHKRYNDFQNEFNKWLDTIDIRCTGWLIDTLKEKNKSVPEWMVNRRFVIDYNERGALDLIRTDLHE